MTGCQDVTVPPQIRVWGSLFFRCYLFCIFLIFSCWVCSVVCVSVFVTTFYRSGPSPPQLTRPHPIVSSFFVLFPSHNFPRPSLSIKTSSSCFLFSFRVLPQELLGIKGLDRVDTRGGESELLGVWMDYAPRRNGFTGIYILASFTSFVFSIFF